MTMDELEKAMIDELNRLNFDYYKSEFGYSEWKTIQKVKLSTCSGWRKDKVGIDYSPNGARLCCNGEYKSVSVNQLKKMFECQDNKQLSLF